MFTVYHHPYTMAVVAGGCPLSHNSNPGYTIAGLDSVIVLPMNSSRGLLPSKLYFSILCTNRSKIIVKI